MSRLKILVVCTGNICRSPFAERLLQVGLDARHLGEFEVRSAGTSAMAGWTMQPGSASLATKYGADPSEFAARQVDTGVLEGADVVLAMTREHRSALVSDAPSLLRRVFTVREFARGATRLDAGRLPQDPVGRWEALIAFASRNRGAIAPPDPSKDDVVDPYGQGDEVFAQMERELVPAIEILVAFSLGEPLGVLEPIERPAGEQPKKRWWWR